MPKLDLVGKIIDKVADNVDRFTLDKEEKAMMIAEINKAQLEVNKVEAGHTSRFVSGWSPLRAGFVPLHSGITIIQPLLTFILYSFGHTIELPLFDMTTLTTVLLGMLGLGGMRS